MRKIGTFSLRTSAVRERPRYRTQRFTSAHLVLSVTAAREQKLQDDEIVVVVPAKYYKKSADRHLLKRRARAILRNAPLQSGKSLQCMFFLKPNALTLPFAALREEFISLLNKIDQ